MEDEFSLRKVERAALMSYAEHLRLCPDCRRAAMGTGGGCVHGQMLATDLHEVIDAGQVERAMLEPKP